MGKERKVEREWERKEEKEGKKKQKQSANMVIGRQITLVGRCTV